MRKKVKERKMTKCECECKRDIKKNISYYRDGKWYFNKTHYRNIKNGKAFGRKAK